MVSPVDHQHSRDDVEREGEAQAPEAGRDVHRPRGGIKGPLLGLGVLALLVIVGLVATNL
ncbi:hypothetical protein DVH29_09295 [Pelagibacterium lacus]|uniref:Uncharacterized protein n=1 Tax=Pelagibacterium lacus TaxID=2282655 RepID=A0A369W2N1_9HYPH|nr:hypothetical protein DVH29_09295 [Pelagibacterium lacus]